MPPLASSTLATAVDIMDRVAMFVLGGYRTDVPTAWSLNIDPAAVLDTGLLAVTGGGLPEAISSTVVQFRQRTGIEVPRIPHAALGWFGIWLHQSNLPAPHPLRQSVWEALKSALGLPMIDFSNSGLVALYELAASHRTSTGILEDLARSRGYELHGSGRARCVSVEFAFGLKVPNVKAERRHMTRVEDAGSLLRGRFGSRQRRGVARASSGL